MQDAFDKQAEELSAMLAESRRWLADVEAAEASRYSAHAFAVLPPQAAATAGRTWRGGFMGRTPARPHARAPARLLVPVQKRRTRA